MNFNMNYETICKFLKYIVCGASIFLALKYVIKNNMTVTDIGLISVIAMLVFAVIENGYSLVTKKENETKSLSDDKKCKAFCSMKENMGNISMGNANVPKNIIETTENISQEEPKAEKKVIKEAESSLNEDSEGKKKSDYDKFQQRFAEIIEERTEQNPDYINKTGWIDRNEDGSYEVNVRRRSPDITQVGSRANGGVMQDSDQKYNITSYHIIPPNVNKGSFEYGYSFLPPEKWYPTPPYPPVCVAEKQCPVCPINTTGANVELKEWNSARRITPPDEINVRYVEEKLNAGR